MRHPKVIHSDPISRFSPGLPKLPRCIAHTVPTLLSEDVQRLWKTSVGSKFHTRFSIDWLQVAIPVMVLIFLQLKQIVDGMRRPVPFGKYGSQLAGEDRNFHSDQDSTNGYR
jgi:hypothetical protein